MSPRARARSQGLAGYLWDGMKVQPGTVREKIIKAAAKVDKQLPPKDSRECPECRKKLSRYTTGPLCQGCWQRSFYKGDPA